MDKSILYNRIEKLSSKQRQLLGQQLKQVKTEENTSVKDKTQLVAYVQGRDYVDTEELKDYIKERLPDYMVPTHIVEVDDFPRLPNGKIDQKTLSELYDLTNQETSEYSEATNEVEQKLVTIWENILDFAPIGIHDNFFEIGGDSILSIQIIAKARKEGIVLLPNQLFEHQTISELALCAQTDKSKETSRTPVIAASATLTPVQSWFFEKHKVAPNYWNQAIHWTPNFQVDKEIVEQAIELLIEKHDSLRLSFVKEADGWTSQVNKVKDLSPFKVYKLKKAIDKTIIDQVLNDTQADFSLTKPCLFKCVYLENEASNELNSIILVAHHILVDAVSWDIINNDLATICQQLIENKEVNITSDYSSFLDWTKQIKQFSQTRALEDLDFWKKQVEVTMILPMDFENSLLIKERNIKRLTVKLDKTTTEQLLKDTHSAYQTKTEDLLITALLQTFQTWTNSSRLSIDFEGYDRENFNSTIDVSNTVGWLTSYFPLSFNVENSDDLGKFIKKTKEELRSVPNGGISYGALRYLNSDAIINNSLNHQPSVFFNYLGDRDKQKNAFGETTVLQGKLRDLDSERHYVLEINSNIVNEQLELVWNFDKLCFKEATIEKQLEAFEKNLKEIINHCLELEDTEFTPSDFDVDLSQDDLDSLLSLF